MFLPLCFFTPDSFLLHGRAVPRQKYIRSCVGAEIVNIAPPPLCLIFTRIQCCETLPKFLTAVAVVSTVIYDELSQLS